MYKRSSGFTIVELLVVIVVIGLLASISLVAYTGVSRKATEAAVVTDLTNTTKQFKLFQIENSNFPTTIDCTQPNSPTNKCIKPSGSNTLGKYTVDNTPGNQSFCLTVKNGSNMIKQINQDGTISEGACTYPFPSAIATNNPAPTRYAITLSWPAITGAESYILQRATDSAFTANLTTLTPPTAGATSYTSSGLTPSTTYYYRMKVTIAGDESSWSPIVNATTAAFPAPAGLAQTAKTTTSISLSWSSVASITNYTLRRSSTADFASYTDATIASGTTTYTSSGLTQGVYYYKIRANDAGGPGAWSSDLTTVTMYAVTIASSQSWTVPAGVTSLQLEAWGAQGGNGGTVYGCGGAYGGVGGHGGYGKGILTVSQGQNISIVVGAKGINGGDVYWNYDDAISGAASGTAGTITTIKIDATTYITSNGGGGGTGGSVYDGWDVCSSTNGSTGSSGNATVNASLTDRVNTPGVNANNNGNGKAVLTY